jgi:DNA-binding LacI/PurR family transcriptional regulator
MGATIKDVAKLANVSPSTVSRVIANNPKISDETKQRVYDAIEELKYHPNAIARSLASKSTNTLGLVLPNEAEDLFKNPFFIQIMTGISVYAQKKGYYIMYAFSKSEEEELEFISSYTGSKLVEGVILLTSRTNDKCIEFLREADFPFVVVGRPEITQGTMWVDNDNFQAMYKVVDYLIAKRHKSIAFIGGPRELNVSQDRLDGYKRALLAHGIVVDCNLIAEEQDFTEALGYEAMNRILKQAPKPTAVVTTDDLLAYGAMKAINEKASEKISVVGFNNTPLAAYQNPPLSSVDINAEKLGYYAAKLLISKLKEGSQPANHYIVETNLVERESTL